MKMYGIQNCDTVKKAQTFLKVHNINFEFIDFRQNPINTDTLKQFATIVGLDKLINKRSTTYRKLTQANKNNISIKLVLNNPTLIKRPVLVTKTNIIIGFDKQAYLSLNN